MIYKCQLDMYWITDEQQEVISGPYITEKEASCELA